MGLGAPNELRELGGFARLATLLAEERAAGAAVWLDSGDALEGASVFGRYGGQVELELLSRLGLSALALGNHELSLSGDELSQVLQKFAKFPVLAANLQPSRDAELRGVLTPGVILDASGLKLGVLGVANPSSPPSLRSGNNPWGLATLELSAAVQAALDDLGPRSDLLIVLSHLGLEGDKDLVRATSGIDLVLGGHQHVVTREPEWQDDCTEPRRQVERGCSSRAVPILHSGAYGKFVTRVTLELELDPRALRGLELLGLSVSHRPTSARVPEDAATLAYLATFEAASTPPLAFLPAPLARHSALGGDAPLGNLVVDALREAAGADVAVMNTSGLRGDLEAGLLLSSDLELALPFDEPWLAPWLRGRELRVGLERAARRSALRDCESSLQVAGLRLVVQCAACRDGEGDCLQVERPTPFGSRPLGDDELLRVALPTYLTLETADFKEARFALATTSTQPLSEVVARYLSRRPASIDAQQLAACGAELLALPPARCREAFGVVACPLAAEPALQRCQRLPEARGGRDERVVMRP